MRYLLLLLAFSYQAQANVLHKNDNGFAIEIKRLVNVDKTVAYNKFMQVSDWWLSDHTWFGDAKGLYIEPFVNGCFCEKKGKKQALHMTVSYISPNNEVRMIGGLGPLQAMGIHGGMTWKFEQHSPTQTAIKFTYHVTGYAENGLGSLAAIVDKVQTMQIDSLATQLNKLREP